MANSTAVTLIKLKYCANCENSMKLSIVNLYTVKLILRWGAILDLTRNELERSMTMKNHNTPLSPKCR